MKKTIFFIMVIIISITTGCSVKDKNIINLNLDSEPKNLDPQTAKDEPAQIILNNIFEGLFIVKEDGTIENGLAKKVYKSDDELYYEITIRDDSYWNNGEKVTANDFVFALKRVLLPETNSSAASRYYFLKNAKEVHTNNLKPDELGVKAISDTVIAFNLEYKNNNFLFDMSSTYVLPCNEEFFLSTKGKYGLDKNSIMSNGPYNLSNWVKNEYMSLIKSQKYFDSGNVLMNKVNFYINSDLDVSKALLDGDIHAGVVDGINAQNILKDGFNYELIDKKQWGVYINQDNEFLSNNNIRKAIINGFNQNSYGDYIPQNMEVSYDLIPDGMSEQLLYYRDVVDFNKTMYNEKDNNRYMNQGLKELGISKIPTLTLLINESYDIDFSELFSYPSQILQKELGVFINIKKVAAKDFQNAISSQKFDMAIIAIDGTQNSISDILEGFVTDNSKNYASYSNGKYDELYKKSKSKDTKERFEIYKQMEQMLLEQGVFIPMYKSFDYFFTNNDFKSIKYNNYNGLIYLKDTERGG